MIVVWCGNGGDCGERRSSLVVMWLVVMTYYFMFIFLIIILFVPIRTGLMIPFGGCLKKKPSSVCVCVCVCVCVFIPSV